MTEYDMIGDMRTQVPSNKRAAVVTPHLPTKDEPDGSVGVSPEPATQAQVPTPAFVMSDTVRQALEAQGMAKKAIEELLALRAATNAQLAQLGHVDEQTVALTYRRPPGRPPGKPRLGRPPKVARPPAKPVTGPKPCPICLERGVKSYNGVGIYEHDRRSHRAENLKAIAEFEQSKGKRGRPALK